MKLFFGSRRRTAETARSNMIIQPMTIAAMGDVVIAQMMPETTQRDAQNSGRFTQDILSF